MSQRNTNNSDNKSRNTFALLAAAGAGALIGFASHSLFSEKEEETSQNTYQPQQEVRSGPIPIQPPEKCIICLGELKAPIEQLPCLHMFHQPCILTWIENSNFCPMCHYTMNSSQINVFRHRNE